MAYPAALDSFTTKIDNVTEVMAADVNDLQTAIVNIETELGLNPAGTVTDVVTRLAQSLAGSGNVQYATPTTLTISSGAITPTQNYHIITTEAAATTDDLDTITTIHDGFWLVLHTNSDSRQVRIRHNAGNIYCANGADIYLRKAGDICLLVEDDTLGKWLALATSQAGRVRTSTSVTTTATLTSASDVVLADASGGAYSITLPAVATSTGWTYTVIKTDSSANAVTLDGNASETINGALTYALSSQYAKVTIYCTGSEWLIIG